MQCKSKTGQGSERHPYVCKRLMNNGVLYSTSAKGTLGYNTETVTVYHVGLTYQQKKEDYKSRDYAIYDIASTQQEADQNTSSDLSKKYMMDQWVDYYYGTATIEGANGLLSQWFPKWKLANEFNEAVNGHKSILGGLKNPIIKNEGLGLSEYWVEPGDVLKTKGFWAMKSMNGRTSELVFVGFNQVVHSDNSMDDRIYGREWSLIDYE